MTVRLHVLSDDEFGVVAAAISDEGEIVATAASSVRDNVYIALDESAVFRATGQLLPIAKCGEDCAH